VAETYGFANNLTRGAYQQMTWFELRTRVSDKWSATWSGFDAGSYCAYDESYVRYEADRYNVRAGRLRSSFGFSDWSELFYSGFNHKPLVREMNLVGKTRLDRDDTGAEVTVNSGPLQIQAAALDTTLTKAQVGPDAVNHASLTAQYAFGQLILGSEVMDQTDFSQKVYGANFRYTVPHWIFKGEYFEGVGPGSGSGSYVDATYRIPYRLRTEIVGRVEQVRVPGHEMDTQLTTIGIRHIFNKYFTANINYGWGKELEYSSYATSQGISGWTARLMFQVQF